jgi:hypothetical protein
MELFRALLARHFSRVATAAPGRFARGDYVFGHGLPRKDFEARLKRLLPAYESMMKDHLARAADPKTPEHLRAADRLVAEHMKKELEKYAGGKLKPEKKPSTIEELLKRQGENGTHSILDITSVSATPKFGAVTPFPKTRLVEFFGSETPSRARIDEVYQSGSLEEGVYIIAYRDGAPSEIAFIGYSGD